MVRSGSRVMALGEAMLPFVVPIAPIWLVLEQVAFYSADGGFLQRSGWYGFGGTLIVSAVIGIIVTILKRTPTKVTIAEFSRNLAYLPVYLADELGYFRREGLTVEFKQTFGDGATWREVVEKSAEFGVADPIAMLDDDARTGLLVAALVLRSPSRAVTKRSMPPVTSPLNLRNVPLRVFAKDTTSYKLLAKYLRSGGIDPENADIKTIQPHTEASHLLDPSNPVVFTIDPEAAAALQSGATEVFNTSVEFGEFINTGVFVRRDFAAEHSKVVQRFVTALEAAVCFMQSNRGFVIDFAVRNFQEASRASIMLGVARLFADKVYPKHVTLNAHLWSCAVENRFGAADLHKFQFSDHVERLFADKAITIVQNRRDWTGLKAKLRQAFRRR